MGGSPSAAEPSTSLENGLLQAVRAGMEIPSAENYPHRKDGVLRDWGLSRHVALAISKSGAREKKKSKGKKTLYFERNIHAERKAEEEKGERDPSFDIGKRERDPSTTGGSRLSCCLFPSLHLLVSALAGVLGEEKNSPNTGGRLRSKRNSGLFKMLGREPVL